MRLRVSQPALRLVLIALLCLSQVGIAGPGDHNNVEPTAPHVEDGLEPIKRLCKKAFGLLWRNKGKVATLVAAGYFAPSVKGPIASVQGKKHIGWGLMLDMQGVRGRMSEEELVLFDNPEGKTKDVLEMLVSRLDSELESRADISYFDLRDVSSLMDETSDRRGRTRHKAIALQALLKEAGIDSKLQIARRKRSGKERKLIYVPELNLVIDFLKKTPIRDHHNYWQAAKEDLDGLYIMNDDFSPNFRHHR